MLLHLLLPLLITLCAAEDACDIGAINNNIPHGAISCDQNTKDKSVYFCGGTGTSVGMFLRSSSNSYIYLLWAEGY